MLLTFSFLIAEKFIFFINFIKRQRIKRANKIIPINPYGRFEKNLII
jgi:hypothetical protein